MQYFPQLSKGKLRVTLSTFLFVIGAALNPTLSFQSISVTVDCRKCGGFHMLPCPVCNGSKKSVHREEEKKEFTSVNAVKENHFFSRE